MSDGDARRDELRDRLAHSRESMDLAVLPEAEPPEDYVALAMDYPFAAIAGGLAIGILAGSLLPRGFGRKLARGTIAAAAVAGKLGLEYGSAALDAAGKVADEANREGREKIGQLGGKLEVLGSSVNDKTRRYGRKAADAANEVLADKGQKGLDVGYRLAREAIKFVSNLRH